LALSVENTLLACDVRCNQPRTTTSPPKPARNPRTMRQAGRQGQIDNQRAGIQGAPANFYSILFTTDYCNSTMTRGILPRPRHPPQCQLPPMNPASQVVHHCTTWCRRNTGVHALHPSYHSPDFPILARLHGSVN